MNGLHGLQWDRVEKNGHSLVLRRADKPLTAADLNGTERKMLERNRIQGLLPFSLEEQDLEITLFYNYTLKRPLAQELRFHPLRADELARLLIDLVFILDNSLAYLLQTHRFVLEPDHIYVDGEMRSLELVYLPLTMMDGEPDLPSRWNNLVRILWADVNEPAGPIGRAMTGMLERNASPAEYKLKLLAALQDLRTTAPPDFAELPAPAVKPHAMPSAPLAAEGKRQLPGMDKLRPLSANAQAAATAAEDKQRAAQKTVDPPSATRLSDKTLLILGVPLLAGWGAYAWLLTNPALYAACGITVFILSIGYHLRGPRSAAGGKEIPEPVEQPDWSAKPAKPDRPEWPERPEWPDFRSVPIGPKAVPIPVHAAEPALAPLNRQADVYSEMPNRTVLLSDPNATVLLRQPANGKTGEAEPFLEGKKGGEPPLRLPIPEKGLLIGRESAEWPPGEEHREMSRQHCEIIRNGRDCLIRDLGSKNGTLLNGNSLIPFKEYSLRQGDHLELAGLSLFFQS